MRAVGRHGRVVGRRRRDAGRRAAAAGAPPVESDYVIHDFHFASGESLPELRLHYTTLGKPHRDAHGRADNAVLILHGTGGSGRSLLNEHFAGVLFGRGQLLDTNKYFVILPDGIGHGKSSKPSDALHAHFPQYAYADMVAAQHALVVQGLDVDHLRLVMGTSMGCMHTFMWGEAYPDFMDALMPLACLPVQIAGPQPRVARTAHGSDSQRSAMAGGRVPQRTRGRAAHGRGPAADRRQRPDSNAAGAADPRCRRQVRG